MNKRTKITKNSLESIGFEELKGWFRFKIKRDFHVDVDIDPVGSSFHALVSLETVQCTTILDRPFNYIDEITQLLTSLTGKNQFYKK